MSAQLVGVRPAGPAQHAGQRLLNFLGQTGRAHGARHRGGLRGEAPAPCRRGNNGRLAGVAALAALDLAEPADQADAGAYLAAVQVGSPFPGRLALRADQHLVVGEDTAKPRAAPAVGVDLPGTAPITGHRSLCRSCLAYAP